MQVEIDSLAKALDRDDKQLKSSAASYVQEINEKDLMSKKRLSVKVACAFYQAAKNSNRTVRLCELVQQTDIAKRDLTKGIALCSEHFAQ